MKLNLYESYQENGNKQEFTQTVLFHPDTEGIENEVVNLYPEIG